MEKSSFKNNMWNFGPDSGGLILILAYHLIFGNIPVGWYIVFWLAAIMEYNSWKDIHRFNSVLKGGSMLGKINSLYNFFEPAYFITIFLLNMAKEDVQSISLTFVVLLPFVIFRTISIVDAPLFKVVDVDEESVDLQLYPLTLRRIFSLKAFLYQLTFRPLSIKYISPLYYQLFNIALIVFYIVAMINPRIGYHFSYVDVVAILMILISFFFNIMRQASLLSSAKLKEESGMSSLG